MGRLSRRAPTMTRGPTDPTFLQFLNTVVGDSGKTLRLAFLLVITAAAFGLIAQLVHVEQQWVWVPLSVLGAVGGVARFRRREIPNGNGDEP
jgi:hypothetical protein